MRGTPGKRRADQSGHHPAKRATFDAGESISSAALADSIPFFGAVGALYSDVLPTVSLLATEAPARRYGHTSYVLTLRQFEAAIAHFTDEKIEPLLNAARSNSCKSAPEFYSHLEKVWKGPQSTDHLGFATFFFDAVHYGLKLSPQKVRLLRPIGCVASAQPTAWGVPRCRADVHSSPRSASTRSAPQ